MTPTNKLRFIERTVALYTDEIGATVGKRVRILQQWWEDGSYSHVNTFTADGQHVRPGEWRDVPLEEV